jgi:hypothetical protein
MSKIIWNHHLCYLSLLVSSDVQHILCCVLILFVVVLSLNCPFLINPSVFFNGYSYIFILYCCWYIQHSLGYTHFQFKQYIKLYIVYAKYINIARINYHYRTRVAQWVGQLDYLTTNTSLSRMGSRPTL